jgi:CBS domain-containing protein
MNVELLEIRDFLEGYPPFSELPRETLAELPQAVVIRYLRRSSSFPPADTANPFLYVVRTGAIELRDEHDQLVSKLAEGDTYSGGCISDSPETGLKGHVVEDSLLYLIDCEQFSKLRGLSGEFDRFFSVSVRERLSHALQALQDSYTTTSSLVRAPMSDLIHRQAAKIAPTATIRQAAEAMTQEGVSALLICDDTSLLGLVTDHDLRTRCIARGLSYEEPIAQIMTSNLKKVTGKTPAFEALLIMTRHDIHHLPVVDGDQVLGVISTTDLIRYQSTNAVYLARDVRRADSVADMAQLAARLPELLVHLVASGVTADQIGQTISSVTDAMTVRLLEMAERELGTPPAPYAWLAVGSHARREQMVHSDQDNALIIDDTLQEEDEPYFEGLARFVNDGLNACGIEYCPGEVMACNPRWRLRLKEWRALFREWIDATDRRAAMLASNFFDMRVVHGEVPLFDALRREILPRARDSKVFIAYMASDALQNRPPLGFFRNLVLIGEGDHANTFDLKHSGVIPIVDLARVQALSAARPEVNTIERLHAAVGAAALSREGAGNLEHALEFIGALRARHQARQIKRGEPPDNYIRPDEISAIERSHLKDAFEAIVTVQKALAQRYQVGRLV